MFVGSLTAHLQPTSCDHIKAVTFVAFADHNPLGGKLLGDKRLGHDIEQLPVNRFEHRHLRQALCLDFTPVAGRAQGDPRLLPP